MKAIRVCNTKMDNLNLLDLYKNRSIKKFAINEESSTLIPFYSEIFRQILGDRLNEKFNNYELSYSEATELKILFEEQIDKSILERETTRPYNYRLLWKEEVYDLNLSLISPNNRRIRDFHLIYLICEECLAQSKPVFMTVE